MAETNVLRLLREPVPWLESRSGAQSRHHVQIAQPFELHLAQPLEEAHALHAKHQRKQLLRL